MWREKKKKKERERGIYKKVKGGVCVQTDVIRQLLRSWSLRAKNRKKTPTHDDAEKKKKKKTLFKE